MNVEHVRDYLAGKHSGSIPSHKDIEMWLQE